MSKQVSYWVQSLSDNYWWSRYGWTRYIPKNRPCSSVFITGDRKAAYRAFNKLPSKALLEGMQNIGNRRYIVESAEK